jgi:hypothetical protein
MKRRTPWRRVLTVNVTPARAPAKLPAQKVAIVPLQNWPSCPCKITARAPPKGKNAVSLFFCTESSGALIAAWCVKLWQLCLCTFWTWSLSSRTEWLDLHQPLKLVSGLELKSHSSFHAFSRACLVFNVTRGRLRADIVMNQGGSDDTARTTLHGRPHAHEVRGWTGAVTPA